MKKSLSHELYHILILQEYLLPLLFVLNSIFGGITFLNVLAEQPSVDTSCCECHTDICEVDINKTHTHLPFLQQQCSFCHVDDDTDVEETVDTAVAVESFNSSTNKVTWLDYRLSHALEHWFIIPFDLVSTDKLIVCAYDLRSKPHKETLLLPAIETIQLKVNDSKPPVIESAEVVGVYQGVLISARIGWFTDKESDSEIRYGIDTLDYSVKTDNFTTDHEIVLQKLQANQIYQYQVISRDIFGNIAESGIALFSTEKLSSFQPTEYEQYQETDFLLDTQFFQNNDSYIMKFTANLPVILSVGIKTINEEEVVPEAAIVNSPDHLPMRSRDEISISVCTKCHAGFTHTGNHPVNVHPPEKAIIPAEYSIRSDGHISCVTCHASHASNYDCRLRFRHKGGNMKAGSYDTVETAWAMGGCLICHSSKGVLPENR